MDYNKLEEILQELKDLGAVSVKTSFEDEGAEFNDIMVLRKLTNTHNLKLIIKIGGAEANTDINMAIKLDCDGIIAPMIESKYALKKYLNSLNNINYEKSIEKGVNLETVNAHNNIKDILNSIEAGNIIIPWTQRHAQLFSALEVERNVMFLILTLIILVTSAGLPF